MKPRFHPVADNPVRMAYVPDWQSVPSLLSRLDELIPLVAHSNVVPATWEPFYDVCPRFRGVAAYQWARQRLQSPVDFATHLALFPSESDDQTDSLQRAHQLLLKSVSDPSQLTRQLLVTEAMELWADCPAPRLEKLVSSFAKYGVQATPETLRRNVLELLQPWTQSTPTEASPIVGSDQLEDFYSSHGIDAQLFQMNGWTPDPGTIYLPVDGLGRLLSAEMLLLSLKRVALLTRRGIVRTVDWEQITLVHVFEGELTFVVRDEAPLVVRGYKDLERVLELVRQYERAATERILQAVAAQATHIRP